MSVLRNIIKIIRISIVFLICRFLCTKKSRGKFLAKSLERLGPSFIKLGQTLSVRDDIVGEDIAKSLARLQDKMPPFSTKRAIATIEKELGRPINKIFAEFNHQPIAAASIAQVHKAVTKKGSVVAVKILRPGIEKKFRQDLALFYFVARMLAKIPSCKRLKPVDVVDVFADTVKKELDLRMEAASAAQLAENCEYDSGFKVPKVFWKYTSRRILVIEWVDGITINDKEALKNAGHNLQIISQNLAVSFLNQAFRDGFFHADIHPGNLFVDKDGNIVPVDFGIMGQLDKITRTHVAEILRGFITGDYMYVAKVHFDADYVPKDKALYDFALACRAIGEPIRGLPVNKISIGNLLALLFKVTEDFDMQTQPQLLLLQKTMVQIEGVGQQLYPQVNMWQMAEGWIATWVKNNLGVEAHIRSGLTILSSVLKNLPERINQLDTILEKLAKDFEKKHS